MKTVWLLTINVKSAVGHICFFVSPFWVYKLSKWWSLSLVWQSSYFQCFSVTLGVKKWYSCKYICHKVPWTSSDQKVKHVKYSAAYVMFNSCIIGHLEKLLVFWHYNCCPLWVNYPGMPASSSSLSGAWVSLCGVVCNCVCIKCALKCIATSDSYIVD